jgi:hypothetical protein
MLAGAWLVVCTGATDIADALVKQKNIVKQMQKNLVKKAVIKLFYPNNSK